MEEETINHKHELDGSTEESEKEKESEKKDVEHFIYHCPVLGCDHKVRMRKDCNPPLNEDEETVSDQVIWAGMKMRLYQQNMRYHMRKKHTHVNEDEWPWGFAIVQPKKQRNHK